MMKPLVKQTWDQINIGEASIVSCSAAEVAVAAAAEVATAAAAGVATAAVPSPIPPATCCPRADPQSSIEGCFEWRIGADAEPLPHVEPYLDMV